MPASVRTTSEPLPGLIEMSVTAPGMFASKGDQTAPELLLLNRDTPFPGSAGCKADAVGKLTDSV